MTNYRPASLIVSAYVVILALAIPFSYAGINPQLSPFYGPVFGLSLLALVVLVGIVVSTVLGFLFLKSRLYGACLGIAIVSGTALHLLPNLEGYFVNGAYTSGTLGIVISILGSGTIGPRNLAPALGILGAEIVQFTAIPLVALQSFLGAALFGAFLLGSYAFVSRIFTSEYSKKLCYILLPVFSLGTYLIPTALVLVLIPVFFWFFMAGKERRWDAGLLVLSIGLALASPLASLVVIVAILAWLCVRREMIDFRISMIAVFALGWAGLNLVLPGAVTAFFALNGGHPDIAPSFLVIPNYTSQFLSLNTILLTLREYLPLGVVAACEAFIALKRKSFRGPLGLVTIFSIVGIAFALSPVPAIVALFQLGNTGFVPYVQLGALIGIGLFALNDLDRGAKRAALTALVACLVVTTSIVAYSSWYNVGYSQQVTQNQYSSFQWLYGRAPYPSIIGGPFFNSTSTYDLVKGQPVAPEPYSTPIVGDYPFIVLPLFGHFVLKEEPTHTFIIGLSANTLASYKTIFANTDYNSSDFQQISGNIYWNRVYSSPDQTYYYVTNPNP